ncbi:MAG: hypothetical protein M3O15_04550 [Acidobacteriota bacterium]|nr:hypothetical protein [Acidobacteriota bacterium]
MRQLFLFLGGIVIGIFAAPFLREPRVKSVFHDAVKQGVKGTIRFGREMQKWQQELAEEIEDAAAEASQETTSQGV